MPSAVDTLIARLQGDCMAAEARLRAAECARAFAWRGRHLRIDEVAR